MFFTVFMLRYFGCSSSYFRRLEDLLHAFHMDFSFYTENIKVLGLLGNSTRLSIVCKLITYGSLSVSDLSKQTRITEDLIVQHLRKLAFGNIVISERIGKRLYFKIKDNKTIEIIKVLGLQS
ncbi:hypothetical protein IIE_04823 [Bacillus cereus VD045]|nr:hypothetical protein IIE_04823 [Bacillus cereus VD045]EJR73008.1 hypothetical protein IK9_05328 [Bacillus cereus VD166]